MRLHKAVVVVLGAAFALVLMLFPYYSAEHPTENRLSVPLGFAWIGSPPQSPPGLMRVERSNGGFVLGTIIAVLVGVYWANNGKQL
jgi:hypothetical protein